MLADRSRKRVSIAVVAALLTAAACTTADGQATKDIVATSAPVATTEAHGAQANSPSTTITTTAPGIANAGAASLDDPYVGTTGNGGYNVASYDLSIAWDPGTTTLDGETTIVANATQDLGSFNLDLYKLQVLAITVDGQEATFTQSDGELVVVPLTPIADGAAFTAIINYTGTPQEAGALGSSVPSGWHTLTDSIYVMGEPIAASTYHPANDHPSDKATFTYRITAPSELTAVAVGTLKDKTDNVDGTTTWVYEQPFPQTTYLTTLMIGPFEVRESASSASGVPIRNVFYADLADEAEPVFARQADMIDAFEPLFGPYPFDVYGSAVVDDFVGGALETQTLSVFGRDIVGFSAFAEPIVAHELAHQWFGNDVSVERWEDLWLNEGFASYSEALWEEAKDPNFDYQAWIRELLSFGGPLDSHVHRPPTDDLFSASVYLRGALTLHALRLEIGDDTFFELLRTWVDTFGGTNATTADFEAMAADVSGQELAPLFETWLRTDGLPAELDGVNLTS